MKIFKLFALLFLLFSSIVSCQGSGGYSNIGVTEVIDGDTIRLANGRLLRYIGIDTPEMTERVGGKFIESPQPLALEASQENSRLVLGKEVRIEFDLQKTDRYSRLLGYCFVGDTLVNQKLLEEGLAVLYTYPPNVKYADRLRIAQESARLEKKGIWADEAKISAASAHEYIGQIRRVQGKVLNTYASSRCVYLNFGADYKTDFTVVIFNNSLKSFKEKNIEPQTFYRGKNVEVRGRIRSYNGPEIIINSPYEIELL